MLPAQRTSRTVQFGIFEVDLGAGELRKRGVKVALQGLPFELLSLLLQRPGEVITRDELQRALWPADSFGEFDQGVNTAVKKVRQALGDSADNPRFIETLPRKGYRFIAPVSTPNGTNPSVHGIQRRLMIPICLTAVFAGAALWFYGQMRPHEEPITPVPLTTDPGLEVHPSFAPDGNRIAYAWNGETQDNFDIYVKQIGSEQPLRLTFDPAKDFGPAWSPDGRFIAFGRLLSPLKVGIFAIPAIGGRERKIGETLAPHVRRPDPFLAWSPDGKWLAFSERPDAEELAMKAVPPAPGDPPTSLFLLSVETGQRKRLTTAPPGSLFDAGPSFSPDGRSLAFVRASSLSVADLYLLDLSSDLWASGEPRRLTFWNQATTSPSWTADGREILVASGRWDASSLWRVTVSGTQSPRRLEFAGGHVDFPVTHKSGRLVYAERTLDTNIWRVEVSSASTKSSASSRFVASTRKESFPQYSPDGRRILYLSDRSGSSEIWLANADGMNPLQVTSMNAPIVGGPRWSPDGERIVFDSNRDGRWEIYVTDASGGSARRLTDHPADECCASWSRDGQTIYFMSSRTGQSQIWRMAARGGEAFQITKQGGYVALESADGQFLYYSTRGGEGERNGMGTLRRVPIDGGEEVEVLPSVTFYNFAVRPEGLFFIPRADPEGRSALHFFSFESGQSRAVAPVSDTVPGMTVSPDGRWVLYSRADERRSDLMLVEKYR